MTAITILAVCLAVAYWLLIVPKQRSRRSKKSQRTSRPQTEYGAASVVYSAGACPMVKTLGDKRFLTARVPQFPLPGCNAAECHCRYVFHDDQRTPDDRRARYSMTSDLYTVAGRAERRAANGRRKIDTVSGKASDFSYEDLGIGK